MTVSANASRSQAQKIAEIARQQMAVCDVVDDKGILDDDELETADEIHFQRYVILG